MIKGVLGKSVSISSRGTISYGPHALIIDSDISVSGIKLLDKYGNEVFLQGITVNDNCLFRKDQSHSYALSYDEVYFKEDDVKMLKQAQATHLDLHYTEWTRFITSEGEINLLFFEDWFDHFVDYCERNEMPYIMNMQSLRHESLQWGANSIPRFVYESAGYESGWWERDDAYEVQADIIFKFYLNSDMEWCRQKWIDTWVFIANRYKNNEYCIGFSLTNEPLYHQGPYMTEDVSRSLGVAYSNLMERCIDAIRNAGAQQITIVDRPFLKSWSHIKPINKPNVVWEYHDYIAGWNPTMEDWKDDMDIAIQKFMIEFGKPIYIGEWGIIRQEIQSRTWDEIIWIHREQVAYMKSKQTAGYAYFGFSYLHGWHDWEHRLYTEEQKQQIMDVIFE